MKRFSKKWTYDILRAGKSKLLNSNISQDIKDITETIPLFVAINCQLRSTAGQLYVIRPKDSNVNKIPKNRKDWTVPVDGENSYLCLELSAHHIYWDSSSEIRNTIIHECGHAINFVSEGYATRSKADWHNDSWKEVSLALGEKPKICCDLDWSSQPAYLNLYHEIANRFEAEIVD